MSKENLFAWNDAIHELNQINNKIENIQKVINKPELFTEQHLN